MQAWTPLPGTSLGAVWTCEPGQEEEAEGQPALPSAGDGVACLLEGRSLGRQLGPTLQAEPGQEVSNSLQSPGAEER